MYTIVAYLPQVLQPITPSNFEVPLANFSFSLPLYIFLANVVNLGGW